MKFIEFEDEKGGDDIKLSYQDYGSGQPVVLIHGWPSSKEMWEYQIEPLVSAGYRVISYDRRGFGKSCKPWNGYDYDTLTSDLNEVLGQLDLQNVLLVGFSMGGGEVARYCAKYGTQRLSKAVFISSVTPFLAQKENNPDGVPQGVFDEMTMQMKEDRPAFLASFFKMFFGVNLVSHPVSSEFLEYNRMLAAVASPRATLECATAFSQTDFRQDLKAVTLPTLIIHGSSDKTVPIEASGDRTSHAIPGAQYIVYEGEPHGIFYNKRDQLNSDLIAFFKGGK